MISVQWLATGRRKSSVARVYLRPGKGNVTVNKQSVDEYFDRSTLRMVLRQPLDLVNMADNFDVVVNVCGGGKSGQAGAVLQGIARALVNYDAKLRPTLKHAGFLTRDSRAKERKKYGLRGARARFQFSKR
ncbi:MAG: 30S ribosomal protein S9 [Proteobacteria bacterium]|jgi:small subunit ribosomal protein S9|nr:30S ribosomal protein S9 [Pseudomonadota bacterium]MBQ4359620.1 30S ribosomal protein S9 [Pseudomonadota bacterium]